LSVLKKELDELHSSRDTAFEMLEKKVYSEETFLQRHKSIPDKIKDAEAALIQLQNKIQEELHRRNINKQPSQKFARLWKNMMVSKTSNKKITCSSQPLSNWSEKKANQKGPIWNWSYPQAPSIMKQSGTDEY